MAAKMSVLSDLGEGINVPKIQSQVRAPTRNQSSCEWAEL